MQALAGSRPKVGNERRSAYAADARHEPVVKPRICAGAIELRRRLRWERRRRSRCF
ncbi:predicted protein [Pyrenophora tritici-repentis Pt-1C-BFP]|uniref:Uncharacterized protein n=1 Tax=Pyrenophora tritici-repentis (strain Pt-1C-BFP) TaxID=426418 RepID=B2VUR8_PYRTR|nr:uncharacterized protein PTRG_02172 [Pyrenophora tritici-repentis Pt-1C-BFP]EDU41610.1 predicted protein [Pyrenophora tritici-repentis Pt-1C-BFP]